MKTMRKLLEPIYLPNIYILNLLTRTTIIKRKEKMSWGRSVGPGESQKIGLSELRWMKNIDNKKKWQGIGRKVT